MTKEPSREFKLMALDPKDKEFEEAFVKRVGTFVIACMNARLDGTIYLGVADNHSDEYYHGQIVGFDLGPNQKALMQKMLEENFTGDHPKMLRGVPKEQVLWAKSVM